MTTPTLEQIEADIKRLPLSEQLWLMERLAQRIRVQTHRMLSIPDSALAAMASDPAIQREIAQIDAEFAGTEADGLDHN